MVFLCDAVVWRFLESCHYGSEKGYNVLDLGSVLFCIVDNYYSVTEESHKFILFNFYISFFGFDKREIGKSADIEDYFWGNEEC